jgi:predicted transcriptional regulator
MPTSKLELCIDIATSLMESGPLTLEQLTSVLETNSPSLERQLEFLVNQEMVKKEDTEPNVTYTIAMRGIRILKFFKVLPSTMIESLEE